MLRHIRITFALLLIMMLAVPAKAQIKIALLKYKGGGDWYANPTSLPNLIKFCNTNLGTAIEADPATVEVGSDEIFNYPFIHMTGHGNVVFSAQEAANLRAYLLAGGFLHIDDKLAAWPPHLASWIIIVFSQLHLRR